MEVLEMKTTITEMNSDFNWLISRLDTEKKRINELEDLSIEVIKLGGWGEAERQRETKNRTKHQDLYRTISNDLMCVIKITEQKQRRN